ncbi:MAG: hypothetical protein LPK07_10870 [Hymenobacteraceae bacterium]|nr:hypothetical protein [Hymenobacteraceae bacterium]
MSIRFFEGVFAWRPELEQRIMFVALTSLSLHLGLLAYLALLKGFAFIFAVVYLVNLLFAAYFIFTIWLDHRPQYRRHLTLNGEGVRYRGGFLQREHEFDWEEVDYILLDQVQLAFVLKNEAEHRISLEHIQDSHALERVKGQIAHICGQRKIALEKQ